MNKKSTFRWQTETTLSDLDNSEFLWKRNLKQNNHRKDIQLIAKIRAISYDKYRELYFWELHWAFDSADLYDENYETWEAFYNFLDNSIDKQLEVVELKWRKDHLDKFMELYVNKQDKTEWREYLENYTEEKYKLKDELEELKEELIQMYKGNRFKAIISLFNDSEKWIQRIDRKKIAKIMDWEDRIQYLLRLESERLHEEIFAQGRSVESFQNLESTWQEKHMIYEHQIRSEWYFDKIKLKVIIIEDIEKIRDSIMSRLPKALWEEYRVDFDTVDNLEEAKQTLETNYMLSKIKDKTFIILDNNFYAHNNRSENTSVKIDAWVKLYKWVLSKPLIRDAFLNNIIIASADDNIWEKFPEGANIVAWKSTYSHGYIWEIWREIKSMLEK